MTTITAAMVKDLRDRTGAGMMDCKTALTETNGDMEAAIEWLRKKGITKAAKKSDRVAAQGLIGAMSTGKTGALVEVNSETDFVARNDQFQDMVQKITVACTGREGRLAKLLAAKYPGTAQHGRGAGEGRRSPRSARTWACAARPLCRSRTASSPTTSTTRLPRVSARSACSSRSRASATTPSSLSSARQLAMHIAASSPLAVTSADLDKAAIDKERDIYAEQAAAVRQAERDHREDGRGPLEEGILPAGVLVEPGLRARRQGDRRRGAEGRREGQRRAGEGHRASSATRSAKASRRRPRTSRPKWPRRLGPRHLPPSRLRQSLPLPPPRHPRSRRPKPSSRRLPKAALPSRRARRNRLKRLCRTRPVEASTGRFSVSFSRDGIDREARYDGRRHNLKYKRLLLKLSGEALMGKGAGGIDMGVVDRLARDVADARQGRLPDRNRGRWRQYLPRARGRRQRHGPRYRRLHGHAGDRHERARIPECTATYRHRCARVVGNLDADRVRAVRRPARALSPRQRPRGDFRRRNRQSLLHHRHRRHAARHRDGLRCGGKGNSSRWSLLGRSEKGPRGKFATIA